MIASLVPKCWKSLHNAGNRAFAATLLELLKKTFLVPIALALAAYLLLPLPGHSAPLSQRIEQKREQVEVKKQREGVLTTTIQRYDNQINTLQGEIDNTEQRLGVVQRDLDAERAELERVRDELEAARDRLERARAKLELAKEALADRLVELYKADQPDALTVVLEADGFNDLLERTEFLERISDQDKEIVGRVRILKARFEKEEHELGVLEEQKESSAAEILRQRDEIAASRDRLASARGELTVVRDDRRGALSTVREGRMALENDLDELEAEQARVTQQLAGRGGRRPDQTGHRVAHLPGERDLHLPVRLPVGTPARRNRHRGARRDSHPRGRFGHRGAGGLHRRLRQLHLHPARRKPVHLLRTPVEHLDLGRRLREPGTGDRRGGQHG